ncbi:hypothetical protein [Butyrivibrio sp. MC2013]|uniref:hypothetical protein n=1 Tax=Butyrivibrio sp. MC2013 TaxID=1280686 RepID=UPI0003FB515B|nr:hypothetical protein [Butyrivibrio sp. MC2013]
MKSESLNKAVKLSSAERKAIVKGLVDLGIDRGKIEGILGPMMEGSGCSDNTPCDHHIKCDDFFSVSPDSLAELKKVLGSKIKDPRVNPIIKKLF